MADTASKPGSKVDALPARAWHNLEAMVSRGIRRWQSRQSIRVKISWVWPVGWLLAIVVLMLTVDVLAGERRNAWPHWLLTPARYVTDAGLSGWYLLPAGALVVAACLLDWTTLPRSVKGLLANWTALAVLMLVGIGFTGLFQVYLKAVFGRARMRHFEELGAFHFEPNYFDPDLSSFPSGHSTTMGAFAALAALLFPKARVFIIVTAILIAFTRVITRAHYPSDVVAGLGIGFGGALAAAFLFARMGLVFRSTPSGFIERRPGFRLTRRSVGRGEGSSAGTAGDALSTGMSAAAK